MGRSANQISCQSIRSLFYTRQASHQFPTLRFPALPSIEEIRRFPRRWFIQTSETAVFRMGDPTPAGLDTQPGNRSSPTRTERPADIPHKTAIDVLCQSDTSGMTPLHGMGAVHVRWYLDDEGDDARPSPVPPLPLLQDQGSVHLNQLPVTNGYHPGQRQISTQQPRPPKVKGHTTSSILGSPDSIDGSISQSQDYNSDADAEYNSGGEEAGRLVANEPSKPRKISQKKKIEQANFSKWFGINEQRLRKKVVKLAAQQDDTLVYMVKKWEGSEKIITKPRDYQLELFERAKKENTIAVLDTGKLTKAPHQREGYT